jgi:hypothetical protein
METPDYKLIRARRKTLALEVLKDATLVVKAPYSLSIEYINKFIEQKQTWIWKKQKYIRERSVPSRQYINGERFLFLGETYSLTVIEESFPPLAFANGFFLSRHHLENAQQIFGDWYRDQALQKISLRVEHYATKLGINYNRIRISNAQSRWGSCTRPSNLSFSWRLAMAPLPIIDYVVVHELVHILEHNHSQRFWQRVRQAYPEYKTCRQWLKENAHRLVI